MLGLARPRVMLAQEQRCQWEYVYGAMEVAEGLAQFQFLPSFSLELSWRFLQAPNWNRHVFSFTEA